MKIYPILWIALRSLKALSGLFFEYFLCFEFAQVNSKFETGTNRTNQNSSFWKKVKLLFLWFKIMFSYYVSLFLQIICPIIFVVSTANLVHMVWWLCLLVYGKESIFSWTVSFPLRIWDFEKILWFSKFQKMPLKKKLNGWDAMIILECWRQWETSSKICYIF